jgi:Uma2 family endonuclease
LTVGRTFTETTHQITDQDAPMPDVSVVLAGRLQAGRTGLIPFSPDLAIEVVSSEPAALLQAKIKLYLRHGTKAVWVAYPELGIV